MVELLSLAAFTVALLHIYLGVYAYRLDRRALANRLFLILCVGCSVWAITFMVGNYSPDTSINWLAYKISATVWCSLPALVTWFSLAITRTRITQNLRFAIGSMFLVSAIFLYRAWFSILLYDDFARTPSGWLGIAPSESLWPDLYAIFLLLGFLASIIIIYRWGASSSDIRVKNQSRVIYGSMIFSLALSGTTDVLLPILHIKGIPATGSLGSVIWLAGIYYSISRYRLLITSPEVVFDQIVSSIHDLLLFINPDGAIIKANAEMLHLLGIKEKELQGKRLEEFLTPVDIFEQEKALESAVQKIISDTGILSVDQLRRQRYLCRTARNFLIPLTGYTTPINDKTKSPVGSIFIAHDFRRSLRLMQEIADRRHAESALAAARDHLESMVQERTAQLEKANRELRFEIDERKRLEEQFRQSQKMEMVGQLAGGIAHDLNNLLTPVRGYAELLLLSTGDRGAGIREKDPGSIKRYAEGIRGSATRAGDLIQKLLTISRKVTPVESTADVNTVLEEVIHLLSQIIDRSIAICRNLTLSRCVVCADHSQLHSALLNLAINARDAMPDGGTLTFASAIVPASQLPEGLFVKPRGADEYVCICISDTGTGMTDEIKTKIFEPFFTTKPVGKGTGLGLASVYRTASNCGGGIGVATAPGMGTTFSLYLPLTTERHGESQFVPATGAVPMTSKILIVDDEEQIREMLSIALNEYGYSVLTSQDGSEALRIVAQNHKDIGIVMTDLNMPRLGGARLIEHLSVNNPEMKIIVMTGYGADDTSIANKALSEYICVQKPFSIQAILTAIQRTTAH